MSPSYDCVASTLLCVEDNSVLGFDFDCDGNGDGDSHESAHQRMSCIGNSLILGKRNNLYANFLLDFPLQSDECLSLLLERELEHMPMADYEERLLNGLLDESIRRDAIDWIWKVCAHYNFGPLTEYISINYLDRFLSAYDLPQGKAWMTQLLSVACLSLACKMEETVVTLPVDLQVGDAKYVFEARTIQRMELLVLSTLKWRMQAVTPFSFVDYFLNKFNGGNDPSKLVISQAMDLILRTIRGTDFLLLRPSEISAAVAITVLEESQSMESVKTITICNYLEKERVLKCYEMIKDTVIKRENPIKGVGLSVPPFPQSPIGVLEATCLSNSSGDANLVLNSTSCKSSPISKRRKISR